MAWKSLYENVLDINNADLAVLIGDDIPPQYQNASIFDRAKYVWTVPEYEDWGDALDLIAGNHAEWRKRLFPLWKPTPAGLYPMNILLGPLNGTAGSGTIVFAFRWFLAEKIKELDLTEAYDRFVITRSDHYYLCAHDLSVLDNDYLWVPSGEDYRGICDRHLVVNSTNVLKALNVLPPLLANPEKYQENLGRVKSNTEQLLYQRWTEEKLGDSIGRFRRMFFTCAQPGDVTRYKKMGNVTPEGVHLKYVDEYEASRGTCERLTGTKWMFEQH